MPNMQLIKLFEIALFNIGFLMPSLPYPQSFLFLLTHQLDIRKKEKKNNNPASSLTVLVFSRLIDSFIIGPCRCLCLLFALSGPSFPFILFIYCFSSVHFSTYKKHSPAPLPAQGNLQYRVTVCPVALKIEDKTALGALRFCPTVTCFRLSPKSPLTDG